ncbi:MAG: hypothetical protein K0U72_03550 [Gammaproteobacteria bacterium]|nr:hypothetical protein [Gammaproteobacteria bacterium]
MRDDSFPRLEIAAIAPTRDAIHGYARILGDGLKACRSKRKHWWHASLRPSLNGLSTGIVRAMDDFELELDFRHSVLNMRADSNGQKLDLTGQSASEVAGKVAAFMGSRGVSADITKNIAMAERTAAVEGYSPAHAMQMGHALRTVATALERFRAGVREETSPVQLWPHHFDLSMIWLPGEKIEGQDPHNEEYSDKQMNFGFAFGDGGNPEPYFYVTAYPTPAAMAEAKLPAGATWKSEGFTGAVVSYQDVAESGDGIGYLQDLWTTLLTAGRRDMLTTTNLKASR